MKLSIYLFKDDVDSFEDLLREDTGAVQIPLTHDFGIEVEAWVKQSEPKSPRWTTYLSGIVDTSSLVNYHTSLLMLAKKDGRFFAVTFGYASALLNSDRLESDFGMKVTANASNPERISAVSVRTVSENSRQQASRTSNKSSISDFGLDIESEWFRYLKSEAASDFPLAKTLAGSQILSLQTVSNFQITHLPQLLGLVYSFYTSKKYKESYPYLDNFVPISKKDPIVDELIDGLRRSVHTDGVAKIGILIPEDATGHDVYSYKVYGDRKRNRENIEEITSDALVEALRQSSSEDALSVLKVLPLNDAEEPARPSRRIYDYLVYEEDRGETKYVLCQGEWFSIAADYVRSVEERMSRIAEVTEELLLPSWTRENGTKNGNWNEGTYNENLAEERGWINLDAKSFTGIGGPHQKIEACDLLTESFDFICVKRMDKSATLSHLFSQAAVSATLYANETDKYKDKIIGIWSNRYPEKKAKEIPRMVIAIATSKPGPIKDSMFFFSKVNLLQRIGDVKAGGFSPVIARIEHVI